MESSTLGLIELLLVFGATLGFGLRELWLLRRDRRKRDSEKSQPPANPPATDR